MCLFTEFWIDNTYLLDEFFNEITRFESKLPGSAELVDTCGSALVFTIQRLKQIELQMDALVSFLRSEILEIALGYAFSFCYWVQKFVLSVTLSVI